MGEPVLRFKDSNNSNYPDSIALTLETFCKFQQGVQVDLGLQVNTKTDGYLPFLRIENYTQKSSDFRYIPERLSKNKIINEDEIAIVRYGATAGFIARGLSGVLANNLFKLIVDDSKISNDYLFHYLRTNRVFAFFQSEMAGGAMPALSFAIVKNLKLNIPSLSEQAKIADFLTALDDKITQLTQKHELLNQYKKGVMQKIFSQELRFKDDDGNQFSEWQSKKLGEIGTFQTSSIDKISRENEDQVFLVNYMNVYRHENINNETIKNFQTVTAKKSQIKSCDLKKGDILFTPSSETPDDIGHSVVIFEDLKNAVFSYHLMRFRPNQKIDIMYSHYFCNFPDVLRQLSKFATGATRYTISVKSFSNILVTLPCLEEQSKIANFLSAIDDKITAAQYQLELLKQYKQGLLQQMFV
jgi:type I restriction enzyme S subunit